MPSNHDARRTLIKRLGLLPAALLALNALAAPAHATLAAAGPIDPASQAPAFYTDANGLQLGVCHPGAPNCGPALPGHEFWWSAGSTFVAPNGGTAQLILDMVASPNASNDPAAFQRIRIQLFNFPSGAYTVTHPFGTDIVPGGGARGRVTTDVGCAVTAIGPCDFAAALSGRLGPFLTAAPGTPAPPAGFIGDAVTEVPVVGSPNGTNFFRVEGPGLPPGGVQSNTFSLMGKLFGGVVPAFGHSGDVAFGDQPVGISASRTLTVTSSGIPGAGSDLKIGAVTLGGPNAADFAITDACQGATLPSGGKCTVGVRFTPGGNGARSATLSFADNTGAATHTVNLGGNGAVAAPAPAPASAAAPAPSLAPVAPSALAPAAPVQAPSPVQSSLLASDLRVDPRLHVRRVRGKGFATRFTAPAGATVARVRLMNGVGAISTKFVVIKRAGRMVVHLRAPRASAGRHVVDVAVGESAAVIGQPITAPMKIIR